MRNHVVFKLTEMAKRDLRIMLVTADLGYNVVEGFQHDYPDRFINCGIAEQNMAAVAAGLALEGNMVFTYSIGNFPTLRCIEQIRNDICYHNANVKILAVGGGFAYGDLGMTHHATEDIAMMRTLPNMRVYVPSDEVDAVCCLEDACSFDGPAYIRMARGRELVFHSPDKPINVAFLDRIIPKGNDINIFTTGTVLSEGIELQKKLSEKWDVGLCSVPRIKPISEKEIREIVKSSRLVITIEEHSVIGGLGGSIAEVIATTSGKRALLYRAGLPDVFTAEVGDQFYLRDYYGISSSRIYERIVNDIMGELE